LTNGNNGATLKTTELTKSQAAFIEYCKEFGWGKLRVIVKNGEPVMAGIIVDDGVLQHDVKFD